MKLALVHDHLNQQGGAEKVLLTLHKLYPDSKVYTLLYDQSKMSADFHSIDIEDSFIARLPLAKSKFRWYLLFMPMAIEKLDLSNASVVLSSASHFAKGIKKPKNAIHICYCHTPTRYLWSHSHKYTEELSIPKIVKKFLPYIFPYLRQWDLDAARNVDYFIANSNVVAGRIKKYYNRDAVVIYPPVEIDNFYINPDIDNYYVVISRFRPYKRVDLAVKTFNKLGIPLKIIGSGEDEKRLKKMAKKNIEFLGNIDDKEKAEVLSRARALIHPQADEDFGITAVEAMAAGRPVIAFRSGGVVETVKDGVTGKFFDEQTWEMLSEVVIRFDHEQFDPNVIREHALGFDKSVFQQKIKTFVESVIT